MFGINRYNPLVENARMEDVFDDFFDSTFPDSFPVRSKKFKGVWTPFIDFAEKKNYFLLKAKLPGMKKKNIHISINDGILSLSGEIKRENEEKKADYYRSERFFGKFERSIRLPSEVKSDKVKSTMRNGILTVRLPKKKSSRRRGVKAKAA